MKYLLLLLLLLPSAFSAEKKPVTLEAVASQHPSVAPAAIWSPAGKEFLYQRSNKLYLYEAAAKKSKELIEISKLESAASTPPQSKRFDWQNRRVTEKTIQWMPDARRALIVAKGDLFLLDTDNRKWEQITKTPVAERDAKPSPDGKKIAFRIEHDLYILDIATKNTTRLTTDGSENILNGELDWVYPEELEIGTAYWWSPDSAQLAYLQFDTTRIGIYPQTDLATIPAFAEPQKYPRTGTPNSDVRLGVIPSTGGRTRWLDLGESRDALLARVQWVPGTSSLFVQKLNRVQNRLDLISVDSTTGTSRPILTETDRTWVNVADDLTFLPSRQQFLWSSERTGFRHLYLYDMNGKEIQRLTNGEWEVTGVDGVDEKTSQVYFTSTASGPLDRQFSVIDLNGGAMKALSTGTGAHTVSMSPAADFYLDSHSSLAEPSKTTVRRSDAAEVAVFQAQDKKALDEYNLLPVEIAKVNASDGALLYARMIKPAGFQPGKKYPAIVMIYGGPHAQTVKNSWSGVNWEQALAHRGFVVWGLDNRGSGGRGHAWESKLYHRFGKQELEDQRAGVEHLLKLGFVDPSRIGMYGWSYGGFMTLYSLLNAPDLFAAGIAGAPVTNWQLYDTIYTERYLGLPQENEAGYRESSAITYAKNLKAKLLLIHNYGDDNVLFQNTFQMADALQKEGKQFEMMIYPQKAHGVTGSARNHLNEMMTDFFVRTLRPGN